MARRVADEARRAAESWALDVGLIGLGLRFLHSRLVLLAVASAADTVSTVYRTAILQVAT